MDDNYAFVTVEAAQGALAMQQQLRTPVSSSSAPPSPIYAAQDITS